MNAKGILGPQIILRLLFAVIFVVAFLFIATTLYSAFFPENTAVKELVERVEFTACHGLQAGQEGCEGTYSAQTLYFTNLCGEGSATQIFGVNQTRKYLSDQHRHESPFPGPAICCRREDASGSFQFRNDECEEVTLPPETNISLWYSDSNLIRAWKSTLLEITYDADRQEVIIIERNTQTPQAERPRYNQDLIR